MSASRVHREGLGHVLADVEFPARTWQLLAAASYFGADSVTLSALHQIPVARYRSLDGVVIAAQQTPQGIASRPQL